MDHDTLIELQTDLLFRQLIGGLPGGGVIEPDPTDVDLASLLGIVSVLRGRATSKLIVDRLWFVRDHYGRVWSEAATASDPPASSGKHVAFDAAFQDGSRVEIPPDPLIFTTDVEQVSLPPNHPRFPETRAIQRNHLPLFGRIVVHEFLHAEGAASDPTEVKIVVDFDPGDNHVLFPSDLPQSFPPRLYGDKIHLTRSPDGQIQRVAGQDPRVLWDLDSAEAHWITHCNVGSRLRLLSGLSEDDFLDRIATELAKQTRAQLAGMFEEGKVSFPDEPIIVDPSATEGGVARAMDFGGQLLGDPSQDRESFALRFLTRNEAPPATDVLPSSVLVDEPGETIGLAISGWSVVRDFRGAVIDKFCLDPASFDPVHPLLLNETVTITADGENVDLESLEVWIQDHPEPGEDLPGGRIRAKGEIHKDGTVEADSDFELSIMLTLDETLRDPREGEVADVELDAVLAAHQTLRNAKAILDDCENEPSPTVAEALRRDLRDAEAVLSRRPHTIGIRPIAVTRTDTETGWSPWVLVAGALVSPLIFVGMLLLDEYIFEAIADEKIRNALGGVAGGGSNLPLEHLPVRLHLGPNIVVYFREYPDELEVSCVRRDDMTFLRDVDHVLQLVGGDLSDGATWRMSVADAVLWLTDPDAPQRAMYTLTESGERQRIVVRTSSLGRRYLRTETDETRINNLLMLPSCRWPEPG